MSKEGIMSQTKDVYQMVTDRIIEQLEKGIIPWQKGWHGTTDGAFNRITRKPYSLLNQMLLSNDGEYATFKQWTDIGGKVKKGAKSEIVVFWKLYPRETEVEEDGQMVFKVKNFPVLKYFNVFHISQVDNVLPLEQEYQPAQHDPIEMAEKVINNYVIQSGLHFFNNAPSNRAYYSSLADEVHVPMIEQFDDIEEYYSTTFHELTHSTKHESRLNRDNTSLSFFGDSDYSKEELVAEIGASNILNILNISTEKAFKNSVAYIQSWLRVLKNDKNFIISASSKAQKATQYILNFTDEFKEVNEEA